MAPYGEVSWVRNARVAGEITLSRGSQSETLKIREIDLQESVPILKTCITQESIVRPYFDVGPNSPASAFVAEAPRHPVFQIIPSR